MRRHKNHGTAVAPLVVTGLFLVASTGWGAATPIEMNGDYGDWTPVAVAHDDAAGDGGGSGIDFDRMWVSNDGTHLFIRIELGTPLVLQESNNLRLYVDTDNNSGTGTSVAGMGADLTWNFGSRSGTFGGSSVGWDDLGLVAAPAYGVDEFELSLRRDATPGGSSLFSSNTIRLVFRDTGGGGDWTPSNSSNVSFSFDNSSPLDPPVIDLAKDDAEHVRIMTYNVLNDGLWSSTTEHTRMHEAIVPDIIAYQEIYSHDGTETRNWVENVFGGTWYNDYDGFERHTVSRYPILNAWDTGLDRARATLIDLPATFDTDLLLINVHFKCCSSGDGQRQEQIDDVMSFVRDAMSAGGAITLPADTPIMILGDTNMYGDAQQITTMLTGDIDDNGTYGPDFAPDWDGSDMDAVLSRNPAKRQTYTYYNEGSSYGPSHIDRVTVTGSAININKSFVLHTPDLDAATLSTYGLQANDSKNASDHIPHVIDLAPSTASTDVGDNSIPVIRDRFEARPNPFNPTTNLSFRLTEREQVTIGIYSAAGRLIQTVVSESMGAGEHSVVWSPEANVGSGTYFARFTTGDRSRTIKLALIR